MGEIMVQELGRKKKLAILIDCFIIGGVEKVILHSLDVLINYYNVSILILSEYIDKDMVKKIPDEVEINFLGVGSKIKWLSVPIIGNCIIHKYFKDKYDYLIVTKPHIICPKIHRFATKIIFWCHGDKDTMYANSKSLSIFRKINKRRLRYIYQRYDEIWFLNSDISMKITKAFGLHNTKVLANPIDCQEIEQKAKEPVEIFNSITKYNIILLGRLSEEKGFNRVIRILKKIDTEKQWHLYIIGGGGDRELLEKLIIDSDLEEKITLLGSQENPYKYLKHMQLLICPSYMESFGLVMLEAMVLKIPVISTDTSGGKYVTQNGRFGKLISNNDEALEEAINDYFDNTDAYNTYIEEAYDWAMQHDIKQFQNNILKLLN